MKLRRDQNQRPRPYQPAAEEKHEHDDDDERCTVHEETPIGSCGQ